MRTLYFDIDGTILREDSAAAKPALAEGRFQALVEAGGFDRIVCVGNMIAVVEQLRELGLDEVDRAEVIFDYCNGAFSDFAWFQREVTFIQDPHHRVRHFDFECDWWYADDLASYYCDRESRGELFRRELGRRVFVPRPNGDGSRLARWLERPAHGSAP